MIELLTILFYGVVTTFVAFLVVVWLWNLAARVQGEWVTFVNSDIDKKHNGLAEIRRKEKRKARLKGVNKRKV